MKLHVISHPQLSGYAVNCSTHYVVGGARWLVAKDDLPKVWCLSRFSTRTEAKKFIEELDTSETWTLDQIRSSYHA